MQDRCLLSGHEATFRMVSGRTWYQVTCEVCGEYIVSREATYLLKEIGSPIKGREYILSGLARQGAKQGTPIRILTDTVEDLIASVVPPGTPNDVMDNVLKYVAGKAEDFFTSVTVVPEKDYPVGFARTPPELEYTLRHAAQSGYLEKKAYEIRLTSKGWDRINELRSRQVDSSRAFVAMWFDPSLDSAWEEGFRLALEESGYDAIRIDREQFNDKIDDRIIADIRRSGLLVADVTGHRQGVYFEAGFAMGLAIAVIWTCREDDIENAHFDTRQYNHIVWDSAQDLRTKMTNRIEATGLSRNPERSAS